jgi:parvulin-like peptidyl-prolyl isomerase
MPDLSPMTGDGQDSAASDRVNANAEFWTEWETKREEQLRQRAIERGELPPDEPAPRAGNRFGLFRRARVPQDASAAPESATAEPAVSTETEDDRSAQEAPRTGADATGSVPDQSGYWTEWNVNRREQSALDQQESKLNLGRTRRRFVLLGILLFIVGIGIGAGGAYWRFREDRLAIAVNGKPISQSEYVRLLEIDGGVRALNRIIMQEEVLQYAAKNGMLPKPEQIKARISEMKSRPDFSAYLSQTRQTAADLERTVRLQLATEAVTTQGVQVSDAELFAFYRANTDPANRSSLYCTPTVATVRAIVLPTREQVDQVQRELSLGVPFDAVARKYSHDPSGAQGGELPPITQGRTKLAQLPSVETAIFSLAPGQMSAAVPYQRGWAIFRCESRTPATTKPFDAVKEDCRRELMMRKGLAGNGQRVSSEFQDFQKRSSLILLRSP